MKFKITNIEQGKNSFDKERLKKIMEPEILDVDPENCPADALMSRVRKEAKANTGTYSKNVEFSEKSIQFFRSNSDRCYEEDGEIYFYWAEIKEENLPPLIVEIIKRQGKYILKNLKELGAEEMLNIRGATRKEDMMTRLRKIFIKRPEEMEK